MNQFVNAITFQDVPESSDYCVFNTHWWTQLVNTVTYQDVPESPDYCVFNIHWWTVLVNTVTYQDVPFSRLLSLQHPLVDCTRERRDVPGRAILPTIESSTPTGGLNS